MDPLDAPDPFATHRSLRSEEDTMKTPRERAQAFIVEAENGSAPIHYLYGLLKSRLFLTLLPRGTGDDLEVTRELLSLLDAHERF